MSMTDLNALEESWLIGAKKFPAAPALGVVSIFLNHQTSFPASCVHLPCDSGFLTCKNQATQALVHIAQPPSPIPVVSVRRLLRYQ